MKVAIAIFVIGEKYITIFNNVFRKNVELYCQKYNYDLIIIDKLIRHEDNIPKKKFYWQRMLIPSEYNNYDYIVSLDSDIYINPNSPPLPFDEIPLGKVAAINERKYMGLYEWREEIQTKMNWERTGKEWHALSGEIKDYNDHINGGLVIYQPKYHAECFKELYEKNIEYYLKYHQDDQSIISTYVIDNNMIYWLDERFNKIWFFWKEIFYPEFDSFSFDQKRKFINNCIHLNYFTHFTSGNDIQYI